MTLARRSFLEGTLAASVLAALEPVMRADSSKWLRFPQENNSLQSGLPEYGTYDYWSHFYDSVDPSTRMRGPVTNAVPAPGRQVDFLHFGTKGLRYAYDVQKDELLDQSGNVQVSMQFGEFRPGSADKIALKNLKSSNMRVDCLQTKPLMTILSPLVWCTIMSIRPKMGNSLPASLQPQTNTSANTGISKIVLPGGLGKVAVNIYSTKESFFDKIMKYSAEGVEAIAPALNFPAVSLVAAKTFSSLWSILEERAAVIMNSPLTNAVASQQGAEDAESGITQVPLLSGYYVMVPKIHTDALKPQMTNLQVLNGWLVDKNASTNVDVETRASQTLPTVTYATMRVTVGPVQDTSSTNKNSSS